MGEDKLKDKKKTAFIITGAAAHGAIQAGISHALIVDRGIKPGLVTGISSGAAVSSLIAYAGLSETLRVWRNITSWRDVFRPRLLSALFSTGVTDLKRIEKLAEPYFILNEKPFTRAIITNMNVETGELNRFDSDYHDNDTMFRATMDAIRIGGLVRRTGTNGDAGPRKLLPIATAIKEGFDDIHIIAGSNPFEPPAYEKPTPLPLINESLRHLQIFLYSILLEDIERTIEKNRILHKYNSEGYKHINITLHHAIYSPDNPLYGSFDFSGCPRGVSWAFKTRSLT